MPRLQIVQASVKDADTLRKISRQTFEETFKDTNTPENLNLYLDQSFNKDKLSRELQHPGSFFYFACLNHQEVAYLKINFDDAQTEFSHQGGMEIERIYVLKDYWGQSIGQTLLDYALAMAVQQQKPFVWLGVWEKNYRALRFYEKNGFVVFDKHVFPVGHDPQTDLLMKKTL